MLWAAVVEVGILSLLAGERATVKLPAVQTVTVETLVAARGTAGVRPRVVGRTTVQGQAIGLRCEGTELDWFADNRLHTAGAVRIRAAMGRPLQFRVELPTGFSRSFAGALLVRAYKGRLEMVWEAEVEELVARIVAAEAPPNSHPEALGAMAILARSWLLSGQRRHAGFAFCDTTHCQHFKGRPSEGLRAVVEASKGQVMLYEGRPFLPYYSAKVGERSLRPEEVGWEQAGAYPYFRVGCPVCAREPAWTRRLTGEAAAMVRAQPGKEATRLEVNRRWGSATIPSNQYSVREEEGEAVLLTGRGQGHGVGYCQSGGEGLARQGWTAARILQHYFPGTSIH